MDTKLAQWKNNFLYSGLEPTSLSIKEQRDYSIFNMLMLLGGCSSSVITFFEYSTEQYEYTLIGSFAFIGFLCCLILLRIIPEKKQYVFFLVNIVLTITMLGIVVYLPTEHAELVWLIVTIATIIVLQDIKSAILWSALMILGFLYIYIFDINENISIRMVVNIVAAYVAIVIIQLIFKKDIAVAYKSVINVNEMLADKVLEKTKKITYFWSHDELTGLENRNELLEKVRKQTINSIVLFDIKHFSYINNLYGLAFGNQVLVEVSNKLQTFANNKYMVNRVYGDRFTYSANTTILPALEIAEQVLSYFKENSITIVSDDITVDVTIELLASVVSEESNPHLYGYVANDPVNFMDLAGLAGSSSNGRRSSSINGPRTDVLGRPRNNLNNDVNANYYARREQELRRDEYLNQYIRRNEETNMSRNERAEAAADAFAEYANDAIELMEKYLPENSCRVICFESSGSNGMCLTNSSSSMSSSPRCRVVCN